MAYWTGKFETLGSNFSNETAFAGCLRPPTTTAKVLFKKIFTSYQVVSEYPHLIDDLDVLVLVLHLH